MEYFILGIASIVIIALIRWYFVNNRKKSTKKINKNSQKNQNGVKCPVCGSELLPGENLISKVYRPMNVPDQLMTVSGCPHCFPVCEQGLKRQCPVCHKSLNQTESLTARLFNETAGKKHVHIVGCSKCHKPRAD